MTVDFKTLSLTALFLAAGCAEAKPAPAPAAPATAAQATASAMVATANARAVAVSVPEAAAKPSAAPADGEKQEMPGCVHGDNPTCATKIDPKVAAEHGPELALQGEKYGAGVTLAKSVSISEIMANPDKFAGQRVRVEGEVEDVCRMRGCWFSIKSDKPGENIKFKVTDGQMVFYERSIGKWAVAEGQVRKMPLTLEQTIKVREHEAKEQGKPFDPATVKEAATIVRIDGLGAVVLDQK